MQSPAHQAEMSRWDELADAERFITSDPLEVRGVVKYRVTGFQPTSDPWRSPAYDAFLGGSNGA